MSLSNVKILNEKLEGLPEDRREKVARYITEHFDDINDELRWEDSFTRTSSKLEEIARKARRMKNFSDR